MAGPGNRPGNHDVLADIEQCFESGWSDGLPVVPPYRRLVDEMRAAGSAWAS